MATTAEDHLSAALACELRGDAAGRADALLHYQALQALVPHHLRACVRLAQAARAAGRLDVVGRFLQLALEGTRTHGMPADADLLFAEIAAHCRLQGRAAEALRHAQGGQTLCGESPLLLREECAALGALGQASERLARLNRLAALTPADPTVLADLGAALSQSPNPMLAIKPLREALVHGEANIEISILLAWLEIDAKEPTIAETRLRDILTLEPNHLGALGKLWHLLRSQCRWAEANPLEARIATLVKQGGVHHLLPPFTLLGSDIDAQTLKGYSARFSAASDAAAIFARAEKPAARARAANAALRVGYLSSDFHAHATAMLMVGVFEAHSPGIEAFAYSYGAATDDAYQQRIKRAMNDDAHWRDVRGLSDAAAAAQIRADGIDVLVELKGYTFGARPGIAAHRPAPVAIHYLGYPGTLAAPGVDFLVADEVIAPPDSELEFNEIVLRLPCCYQANDSKRARPEATPRAELGLPDDALVLCNFNQSYKWSERFMRVWLRALRRAPSAILWLLEPGEAAKNAIFALAAEHGVRDQLHWAPQMPMHAHLARLGAANLALDQLPCASHTTGADALWMGVPLLTCVGSAYQGRVGASLCAAAGLEALITPHIEAYERRLDALVTQPERLRALQHEYTLRARQVPLFETAQFTQHWEALLQQCCANATRTRDIR